MKTTRSSSSQQKRSEESTVSSSTNAPTEYCGDARVTALGQGGELDMPVVVQRQAPTVQTVLGGSAVAVHRQAFRDSTVQAMQRTGAVLGRIGWPARCCAQGDQFQTKQVLLRHSSNLGVPYHRFKQHRHPSCMLPATRRTGKSMSLLSKTVPQTQFVDRAVNIPLETQRQVPTNWKIKKTVEMSHGAVQAVVMHDGRV